MCTAGELVDEFDSTNPADTEDWKFNAVEEDHGWGRPHVSKCAARVVREEPWAAMVGMPRETKGALTAADSDYSMIAEIGVWMAWITEARNSNNI